MPPAGQRKNLRGVFAHPVSIRVVRLRQATVWRARTCLALSGSLHASRGYLQPPHSCSQRFPSYLPMEGLRASQQTTHHDPDLRGISAPLFTAPLAKRIPAHSLLRLARQSKTEQTAFALSRSSPAHGRKGVCPTSPLARTLAMPTLPRTDVCARTAHGRTASRQRREAGMRL